MISHYLTLICILCSCCVLTNAAFGITSDEQINDDNDDDTPLVDLDDEELQEVMEMFALMSDEEREEAFEEVMQIMGEDAMDEDTLALIKAKVKSMSEYEPIEQQQIPPMKQTKPSIDKRSTNAMMGEMAKAVDSALDLISKSEWSLVYEKRGGILETLIELGKISSSDAKKFKRSDGAWEKELRHIWDELQSQANERSSISDDGRRDEL